MVSDNISTMTANIKPEMSSGVQTGNGTPHDKQDMVFSVKLQIDFGGVSSCCSCFCSCCSCERGKTKSTPSPNTEVWTWDWSLTI